MGKLILVLFLVLSANAGAETLLEQMAALTKTFASYKPAQREIIYPKFPEAMHLLSFSIEDKTLPVPARIAAAVKLAAATVPFDKGIPAAEILADDYVLPGHTAIYKLELARIPDEAVRNRLSIAIERYAETAAELHSSSP